MTCIALHIFMFKKKKTIIILRVNHSNINNASFSNFFFFVAI